MFLFAVTKSLTSQPPREKKPDRGNLEQVFTVTSVMVGMAIRQAAGLSHPLLPQSRSVRQRVYHTHRFHSQGA